MVRRAVLLVPVVVLAAALAAPVPKRNPLAQPVLTSEALAKLPFVDADRPADGDEAAGYPKPGTVGLAVYLHRDEFLAGDPIPALFAVKNRTARPLGLDMALDLSGRQPDLSNSCDITVRNHKTGEAVGPGGSRANVCGKSGGTTTVAKDGYYAVRGNVGTLAGGDPLPPGEYELSWRYGWAKSDPVRFTVRARRAGDKPPPAFAHTRIVRVTEEDDDDEPKKGAESQTTDAPPVWAKPGLRVDRSDLQHALATGEFGRYFPSVRELPEADGGVTASARWDGDKLTVKLEATHDAKHVGRPAVYLLVESADADSEIELQRLERARAAADERRLPYTLEVRLPKDWRERAGAYGKGRVAVLLVSREPRSRGDRADEVKLPKGETNWVVRTDWHPVTFPEPKEKADR